LSEDDTTDPKEIRFSDKDRETTEKTIIAEGGGQTQVIAALGSLSIPMGNVAAGKWFYLYGDKAHTLSINGGAAITMAVNKVTEAWMDFTSLEVTNSNTTDVMRLTWGIGGE